MILVDIELVAYHSVSARAEHNYNFTQRKAGETCSTIVHDASMTLGVQCNRYPEELFRIIPSI
jgi:hypothetical protein